MSAAPGKTVRIGTLQPKIRLVDWRLKDSAEVLARVDATLGELEALVHKAGDAGCDVVALPEDCLGLGSWEEAHHDRLGEVLPQAIRRMLDSTQISTVPPRDERALADAILALYSDRLERARLQPVG